MLKISNSKIENNKHYLLKMLLIISLMSADIGKVIGMGNINFYIILIISLILIISNSISKEKVRIRYIKDESSIYISISILIFFIVLYTTEYNSLIHAIKLFIIFYIIYPTLRTFFSDYELIRFLKFNLIINFILILFGKIGIEFLSSFTGFLRGSTILNYAGSLYKVGLILIPYLIWELVNDNKGKLINILLLIMSLYIMFYDGSRTAIISLIIILLSFFINFIYKSLKSLKISLNSIFNGIILLFLLGIIFFVKSDSIINSNAYIRGIETIDMFLNMNFRDFLLKADGIRGYMIFDGIRVITSNYLILGKGFQTTMTSGIVLHNAYLQIFADLGIFSFISLLVIIFNPIIIGLKYIKRNDTLFPSVIVLIIFSFLLLLHPLSVQPADWALYIIPLSIVMRNIYNYRRS